MSEPVQQPSLVATVSCSQGVTRVPARVSLRARPTRYAHAPRARLAAALWLVVLAAAGATPCWSAPQNQAQVPAAQAAKVTTPIRLDGVSDEEAWTKATPIRGLLQVEPIQGATPSEDTEVRVIYDADHLYFGITCRDRTPSGVVSTQLGRDAELDVDDQVVIVIDPFADQRNGFFFAVNPAGARRDGQISNNSPEMSTEWDGIWDARARITSEGWVAEIAIPFKSLRFKPGQTTWGLNIERQIKRRQEIVRWASARNDVWLSNLAAAGQLGGLVGLQQGRGLDIRPFVSGGEKNSDGTAKVGLDVVKSLTPNMTGSLTINTDFAETEVDSAQVNLTRFPLFFPEKRTFFLEGAGVYDVAGLSGGGGGGGFGPPPDLLPFHSRTIGLYRGEEIPILAGAKVTGRQSGYNVGFLDVQTRTTTLKDGDLEAQNLLATRVSRNIFEQSWVGVIATHGDPSGEGDNSLIGFDARLATSNFKGGRNLSLDLFAMRTDDTTLGADYAFGFKAEYPNDRWRGMLALKQIGDDFRPALGFVPRAGIRKAEADMGFNPRPGRWGIRQIQLSAGPAVTTDLDWRVESFDMFTHLPQIEFDSGEEVALQVIPTFERLVEPFEIQPGVVIPPGSYRWTQWQVEASTASKRAWVVEVEMAKGGFYTGTMNQIATALTLKPSSHLALEVRLERSDVSLPEGDFVAKVFSTRVDYSASTNITWSNQLQYDTDSKTVGFQSRFRWILRPGNDVFFVVGRGWSDETGSYVSAFHSTSAKLQYTFRL
jgi:hypothetical protein